MGKIKNEINTQYQGDEAKTMFNVALLGAQKCGKTSLLDACLKHSDPWKAWPSEYDHVAYELLVDTSFGEIRLNIIDYNAQPTDEQLGCLHGVLLIQDITNSDISYIQKMTKRYKQVYPQGAVFLAATKSDCYGDELFSLGQIQQLAQDMAPGAAGCVVSGREKHNIDFLLFMIADKLANPNQKYFAVENTLKQINEKKSKCTGQ
ncbi:Ras-like GTPase superfamily protein [Spironucleus salmonicida]|uniref:Ras-like GTPase superfamily protein n=1 Tax=Spironucleus salmonicida TaxID=348837 RepID=V6LNA9_9EUKA|nr:Ras-like GTPase superfamily protein [Spironucleus salmonicida]|eukprot:EST46120.1 Ras-like GTPase superfamily protein [Spironucleus salmonicida]